MGVVQQMNQKTATGAVLKGADHFFRGREKELMDILGACNRKQIGPMLPSPTLN